MPSQPPKWIKPQLTRLADEAPAGSDWLHETKYDGYRILRQVSYQGQREDKPARTVVRSIPHPGGG
jgi:ATP-dependent DNA ligase